MTCKEEKFNTYYTNEWLMYYVCLVTVPIPSFLFMLCGGIKVFFFSFLKC